MKIAGIPAIYLFLCCKNRVFVILFLLEFFLYFLLYYPQNISFVKLSKTQAKNKSMC